MQMQQYPEKRSPTWAFKSHFSAASSSLSSLISLFGWTNLTQPLIIYIFQGNCKSPEEEAGFEIKQEKMMREEKRRWRVREGGRWGGVKRELVSVCSNRSSRSLFHSGIFGFFQSGCCSSGLGSPWLPRLVSRRLCVRTLHVWHADMGPSLRSRITVCLLITLAQVIAVTCQEDTKKGEWQQPRCDCSLFPLIFCLNAWYVYINFKLLKSLEKLLLV